VTAVLWRLKLPASLFPSELAQGIGTALVTTVVGLWIADWRVYLQNRRDYTAKLRKNPRTRFLVSIKPQANNDSYDTVVQAFSDANNIPECDPPTDLA